MNILELLGINLKVTAVIIVAFAVLFITLYKLLFKKIGGIIDEREVFVRNKYKEIEEKEAHVQELVKQYEQKLQDIEKKALEKMQEAVKEGVAKRDQILAQAKKDIENEMARTRRILETEGNRLREELTNQTGSLVLKAIEQLLPEIIDDQIQNKILTKFEEKLKKTPSEQLALK